MALRGNNRYERSGSWRSYKALPPSSLPSSTFISACASDDNFTTTQESCNSWVKYAIYACNIVFLVVGVTTLSVGAWLRTDSRFREFLSERYRNAVEEAFWEAPTLYIFSYILIVLGACMVVVSIFGCCGAVVQSKVLLIIYTVVVAILMLCTLSAGIYIIYKRDGIDVEVSDALTYMVQHYYQGASVFQESLDRLQQTFRCCGNAGCGDFRVFRQDPPRTCDIRCDGCHYRIMLALRIGFTVAFIVFSLVVLLQLFVVALSMITVCREREKPVYSSNRNRYSSRKSYGSPDRPKRYPEKYTMPVRHVCNGDARYPSHDKVYDYNFQSRQRY